MYKLIYTENAKKQLVKLKKQGQILKLKKIKLAFDKLSENPYHNGLHAHKNSSIKYRNEEDTFQSYVENRTPGAYRIFWHYGEEENIIVIIAITPHP